MDTNGKLEKLSREIYCIGEAITHLEQAGNNEDVIEVLKDRLIVLGFARDALHRIISEKEVVNGESV